MLENYKNEQPLAYKILTNSISKNEHSHAYLFESNGYNDTIGLAIALAKSLFCVKTVQENETICDLIDKNNFPEFKIIDPEGLIIKKEEIDELKIQFSKKPIYSDRKIYIINNAERLNKASANTLLKFLEEPEQDIIAILITNNIYEILNTIISRCQIISLKENLIDNKKLSLYDRLIKCLNISQDEISEIFKEENVQEYFTKCIEFINYYERYKLDTYIYLNNLWFSTYKEKDQFIVAFKLMTLYYIDILKKACHTKIDLFYEYEKEIETISENISIDNICFKIKTLIKLEKKVKENNNLNLIMDKLILTFGRSDVVA